MFNQFFLLKNLRTSKILFKIDSQSTELGFLNWQLKSNSLSQSLSNHNSIPRDIWRHKSMWGYVPFFIYFKLGIWSKDRLIWGNKSHRLLAGPVLAHKKLNLRLWEEHTLKIRSQPRISFIFVVRSLSFINITTLLNSNNYFHLVSSLRFS